MPAVTAPLTSDMVASPQMWRMALLLSPEGMDVAITSLIEDNSLIYKHIPLPSDASSRLRVIEETIYENPLLLSDFRKVDILVRTRRFLVIPSEITEPEVQEKIMTEFWPDIQDFTIFTDSALVLPGDRDSIVFAMDGAEASFLQRTFPTARISHALTPMVRYFAGNSRLGCSGKMYVCLRQQEIDIIAYTSGGLQMAVTTSVASADDALYYVMAALHTCKLSPSDVEIMLCGDNALRQTLTPMLRKFVGYVMPVVIPSAIFRTGKDALAAPFSLMLIPLCE